MTVRKGTDWGHRAPLPEDGIVVATDAQARAVVERARRANEPIPALGLVGGDLCRTLGGTGDRLRLRSSEAMTFPVDLGTVLVDGRIHWFVAHLVARRSWWRGRVVAAMNAQWLGSWDLGPKAHPGDGLLDITDGDLPFGDRLQARRRLPTGTHLPHPALRTSRVAAAQLACRPALDVWLDGERVARASSLSIRVEPDTLTVVV